MLSLGFQDGFFDLLLETLVVDLESLLAWLRAHLLITVLGISAAPVVEQRAGDLTSIVERRL